MRRARAIFTSLSLALPACLLAPLAPTALASAPPALTRPAVVELSQNRRASVVSAWTASGSLLHVRPMPEARSVVAITLSMIGGELLEDSATRGVSRLAAEAWEDELEAAITDSAPQARAASVRVTAAPDALQVRLLGSLDQVEQAVSILRSALLNPKIDPAAVERAQRLVLDEIETDRRSGRSALGTALVDSVFPPAEPRVRPMQPASVQHASFESVSRCLASHIQTAPIEIGVAGDISLDVGLKLAASLVSELPARPRISADWRAPLRAIPLPKGPMERTVRASTPAGMALVLSGFLGADAAKVPEFRTLRAASRVLDRRVRDRLREAGLIDRDNASSSSLLYSPYPGFGMILLSAVVPDASASAARAILADEIDRLTADAPSAPELDTATAELAAEAKSAEDDPAFWASILSRSTFAGLNPDEVIAGESFYQQLTPDNIRATLRDRWQAQSRVTLVVREAPKEAPPK